MLKKKLTKFLVYAMTGAMLSQSVCGSIPMIVFAEEQGVGETTENGGSTENGNPEEGDPDNEGEPNEDGDPENEGEPGNEEGNPEDEGNPGNEDGDPENEGDPGNENGDPEGGEPGEGEGEPGEEDGGEPGEDSEPSNEEEEPEITYSFSKGEIGLITSNTSLSFNYEGYTEVSASVGELALDISVENNTISLNTDALSNFATSDICFSLKKANDEYDIEHVSVSKFVGVPESIGAEVIVDGVISEVVEEDVTTVYYKGTLDANLTEEDAFIVGNITEYSYDGSNGHKLNVTFVNGESHTYDIETNKTYVLDEDPCTIEDITEENDSWFSSEDSIVVTTDCVLSYQVSDQAGIGSISVSGIPAGAVHIADGVITINTESLRNFNINEIGITASDKLGNETSTTVIVKRLVSSEGLELSVSSQDFAFLKDGVSYVKGGEVFNFSITTSNPLVNDIYLVKGIEKGDAFVKDGQSFSTSISEAGSYSILVSTVGGDFEYALELQNGLPSVFDFDDDLPTIDSVDFGNSTNIQNIEGVVFILEDGNISYELSDPKTDIQVSSVTAGESENAIELEFSYEDGVLTVPTAQLNHNEFVTVNVTISDSVGNEFTQSNQVYIVNESISVQYEGTFGEGTDYYIEDGVLFFKDLSCKFLPKDCLVNKIEVIDGEENSEVIFSVDAKDIFNIDLSNYTNNWVAKSGEYSIKATDIFGRETIIPFSDLASPEGVDALTGSFVKDTDLPEIGITVDGKDISSVSSQWHSGDIEVIVSALEGTTYVSEVQITVNGIAYGTYTPNKIKDFSETLDFSKIAVSENGIYVIECVATDFVGNATQVYRGTLKYDTTSPTLNVSVTGSYKEVGSVVYIESTLNISNLSEDNGSGLKSLELVKDGDVIGSGDSLVISEDGTYSLRLTDNMGLVTEEPLNVFLPNAQSSVIVVDEDTPVITFEDGFTPDLVENSVNWFKSNPTFNVSATDSHVRFITIKLNDTVVCSTVSEDGLYTIDTSKFSGYVTLSISVEDYFGHKTEKSYAYRVDTAAPTVFSGSLSGSYQLENNVMYFKSEPTLTIYAQDTEVGIEKYVLSGDKEEENTTGVFTLPTGEFSVKVIDKLGNESEVISVKDLCHLYTNVICVDSVNPTVALTVNGEELTSNWLSEDAILGVSVSDNIVLKSLTVYVNAKQYDYPFSPEVLLTEDTKYINLKSEIDVPTNGQYSVRAVVTDVAGNKYESDTYTIMYDFNKPTINVTVDGIYTQFGDYLYVDGVLTVKDNGSSDIGSGISKLELVKDGEVLSQGTEFTISSAGTYSIRVTDNAGLVTEVPISNFINGVNTSQILFDNEAPVISRVSGFDYTLNQSGVLWYEYTPSIKFSVSDVYLQDVWYELNGETTHVEISESGEYIVPTKDVLGTVSIKFFAKDRFGHISEDAYSYKVDVSKPVIKEATLIGDYTLKNGVMFFKDTPSVVVVAEDVDTGISAYILGSGRNESNTNGMFTLGDGEYTIEVVDNIGNTTGAISIKDLCHLNSNIIVVDGTAPTISASRPEGDVDGWFNSNVTYTANVADNQGINKVEVYINDKLVNSNVVEGNETKTASISASTEGVTPNNDGSYNIVIKAEDNTGNTNSWSDTIFVDSIAPTVEQFTFTGDGYQEGVTTNGSTRYGFYFTGAATCTIKVSDGEISSGMSTLVVTLTSFDGGSTTTEVPLVGGYGDITIPNNFKGYVSAYAVDRVGNKGNSNSPDGIITEDGNCFINNLKLAISLPATDKVDKSGLALYKTSVTATADIGCNFAGIRSIQWGVDSEAMGSVNVDNNGNVSGDVASVTATNENLVLDLSKSLSIVGNKNAITVWVSVTDRTGRSSRVEKQLSIDTDAPVLTATWNTTENDGFYKDTRVLSLRIKERNFNSALVSVTGVHGTLGTWNQVGEDEWTSNITFTEDGEYKFSIACSDMAGNVGNGFTSDSFVIDKTSPVMNVTWNNSSAKGGRYYNEERVATISVQEKNFNPNLIKIDTNGVVGTWGTNGNAHTVTVSFKNDGDYSLSVSGKDLADNEVTPYSSGVFIIDTTTPEVKIEGVEDNVSYKKDVSIVVKITDEHLDVKDVTATLKGRHNETKLLEGSISITDGVLTFSDFPEELKVDDIYTLTVHCSDLAGNTYDKEITFSVNRFGSTYQFLEEGLLGKYINKAEDVSIREVNVDKLDTKKVKIVVNHNGVDTQVDSRYINIKESTTEEGRYEYVYSISSNAFTADGKYLVQIYSQSDDGTQYSSISEEYAFILDTISPEIILSGIKDNGVYHEYSQLLTVDLRDATGIADVKAYLNGAEVTLDEANGIYSVTILEGKDLQSIKIVATDLAGNSSEKEIKDFYITSSLFAYLINQWWFKLSIGLAIAVILALFGLIFKNRHDARKEEKDSLKRSAELYKSSSSQGSGSGSGSGDTESK